MTPSDLPEQFENVTYSPYSDTNWGIAMPNYNDLVSILNSTIYELQTTNTSTFNFQLTSTYQLNRQVTSVIATDSQFVYPS